MKIALRGGHNHKCIGARALVDEVLEDRKVYPEVKECLECMGHEVVNVTCEWSDTELQDLDYGITRANNANANYFASIHFNSFADVSANGTEVCYTSDRGKKIAECIVNELASLGFRNRGVKKRTDLRELNKTNAVANIIEVCFLTNEADIALYNKLGVRAVGKAIARGINKGLQLI